jgi:hypothetical protein
VLADARCREPAMAKFFLAVLAISVAIILAIYVAFAV